MRHTNPVERAIQAALNDINLLRVLVRATSDSEANEVLSEYNPKLKLRGNDVKAFFDTLKDGRSCITAAELVDLYDGLQPPKRPKAIRGKEGEWVPRG